MDPDGNIYEAHPDDPAEDKARYDGYVRGLVASDGEKAAEIARLRDELAQADSYSSVQAFRANLNEHLRREAQEEREQTLDTLGRSYREYIVCQAAGYPDPYSPTPMTLENAVRFADQHRRLPTFPAIIRTRLVTEWVDVEVDGG